MYVESLNTSYKSDFADIFVFIKPNINTQTNSDISWLYNTLTSRISHLPDLDSVINTQFKIKVKMKLRPVLMFILLMVIYDVGANLPKLPIMQCPVGTSLDSAFFFGQTLPRPFTDPQHNDAIDNVNTRLADYKGKTQAELRSMLMDTCDIPASVTDADLINRTSVYEAVKKFKALTGSDSAKCFPARGRQDLEDYVENLLTDKTDKRWFHMFKGFLNPQDVTMMACDAEFHFPNGQLNFILMINI